MSVILQKILTSMELQLIVCWVEIIRVLLEINVFQNQSMML